MSPKERPVPPAEHIAWDAQQVGAWLGIGRRAVIRHVHENGWPYHKVSNRYRFTPEDRAKILEILTVRSIHPEPPTARLRRLRHEKAS